MAHTRDLVGYGGEPPHAQWPGDARLAVNFVLNYEEGSEYSVANGDLFSETTLTDAGPPRSMKTRDLGAESLFEYGARAGFWRIHRAFTERGLPLTLYGCAMALEANPAAAAAIRKTDWDIAGHGWRWMNHFDLEEGGEGTDRQDGGVVSEVGWSPTLWLVLPLRAQRQHAPIARRGRRFPLRFGLLCRRSPVLGKGRRTVAPCGAVQHDHQ